MQEIVDRIPTTSLPMPWIFRARNEVRALLRWCLSFSKKTWTIDDYPLYFCVQYPDPASIFNTPRFTFHRYMAEVVHWNLTGFGDSKSEAFFDLQKRFQDRLAEGDMLPRPGKIVPVKFTDQSRINAHPMLVDDFIQRVLELEEVWISDESSLWDFHCDDTNERLIKKVYEVYGVKVDDIQSARLCEIFDRIAESQRLLTDKQTLQ